MAMGQVMAEQSGTRIDVARGACLCGAVRFRAALPSIWVAHCHCTYCRRAHGAAFVTWAGFAAERFSLEPGSETPAWHESSPGAKRAHCAHCGSPMFFQSTRWPGEMHVARALFTDPLDKDPTAHVFYETHVPWLEVGDALPKKASPSPAQGAAPPAAAAAGDAAAPVRADPALRRRRPRR